MIIKKTFLRSALGLFILFAASCSGGNQIDTPKQDSGGGIRGEKTSVVVALEQDSSPEVAAQQKALLSPAPTGLTAIELQVTDKDGVSLVSPITILVNDPAATPSASLDVPSGSGRIFIAKGFDSNESILYQGQATADLEPNILTTIRIVMLPNAILVSPPGVAIRPSTSQQFAATVIGLADKGVEWSVNGVIGGNAITGTVTQGNPAVYTAPAIPPSPNTVIIKAASKAVPAMGGTAELRVVTISQVEVSPSSLTRNTGKTAQFTAITKDTEGASFEGPFLTWTSSDTAIASVSNQGLASCLKGGTTTIKVTAEGVSGSASLTCVIPPIAAIEISPISATIFMNQGRQFFATAKDADGSSIPGISFTWSSDNTPVATINSLGLATGVTVGEAQITAEANRVVSPAATLNVAAEPLSSPYGIAIESGGNTALITESTCCNGQGRLRRIDLKTLEPIQTISTDLQNPRGIAVEARGETVLVVEEGTCCPSTGKLSRINLATGTKTLIASLNGPRGIAIESGGGTAIITESARISRVNLTTGSVTSLASLSNLSGIVIESGGENILASVSYGSVIRVNLVTGSLTTISYGLASIGGLSLEPDGSVLVTDSSCCSGTWKLSRISLDTGVVQTIATGLLNPVGLAIEAGGASVIIVEQGYCCPTQTNARITRKSLPAGKPEAVTYSFKNPAGLAIEADGTTALTTDGNSRLFRVILSTGKMIPITSSLNQPQHVAIESEGKSALVTEWTTQYLNAAGKLSRVDLLTGQVTTICKGLSGPQGIAIEADKGTALIAETGTGSILRCNLTTGTLTIVAVNLNSPQGIAIEAGGDTVLVAEYSRVSRVNLSTGSVTGLTSCCFYQIANVAIESGGNNILVVRADCCSAGAMERIDLSTGTRTPILSNMNGPQALLIEEGGQSVLVVERNAGSISRVNISEKTVTPLVFRFASPQTIVMESTGTTALVSDRASGKLLRLNLESGTVSILASGLSLPRGIAIESNGSSALVTEQLSDCCSSNQQGRLSRIDLTTGTRSTITENLSAPFAVAVEAGGETALVTDGGTARLLRVYLSSGTVEILASGISVPTGLAIEQGGATVLIAQSYCCQAGLSRITLSSGDTAVISRSSTGLVAIEEGGATALTTGECCSTQVGRVDLTTGNITPLITGLSYISGIAIEPGGKSILVVDQNEGKVIRTPLP